MFIKNWKKEILSIPNLLSLSRLLIIPVYITMYMNAETIQQYSIAGSILILSCLTDMIDGKIARRYNMITTLGKILDPLADKITQFSLISCLSLKYTAIKNVLFLFLIKEIFQITLGIIHLFKGEMLPGALWAGKICTTVLFFSLITLVIYPNIPSFLVNIISFLDVIFLIFSFICYLFTYFNGNSYFEDLSSK